MAFPLVPVLGAISVYLTTRVIAALGFGFVVYTGVDALYNQFYQNINSGLGGIPADMLAISTLFGFIKASQIILGALSVRLSFIALKRFTPL